MPEKRSAVMLIKAYLFLLAGIVAETVATIALKESNGFTRWVPVIASIAGYGLGIVCLGYAQRDLPMSLITSMWSGLGITLITVIAAFRYQQVPTLMAIGGISLIIAGIILVNLAKEQAT
ncbi:QacE family quaternary ammonium compound efflux SMR transporter [Pseudomonas syringae pv. syringae]|nr:QacE family quaternary ammonium compound efflux SMR transporter [Pseudomonas syringae pv. syringae]MCF5031152.1 QacE family quaternary ammonium compound efflux SMR transporter [Pseudomonas syringae]MCF5167241.1 QacE family quaternary ammonium compound efflux SMR transporter [Pseudomonas congelans]QGG76216.1 QacE family quaternary ammonium compound efflux SMR transporter [Pseudomonas syringae USA011]MCF5184190.1 QacE family quaternary ammonium compound efflux SMR transporter [Pseudomonas syri